MVHMAEYVYFRQEGYMHTNSRDADVHGEMFPHVCCECMQAVRDVQAGTRILYVICAEGKANKNITIANLVSTRQCLH